jgi:hypothetical protein
MVASLFIISGCTKKEKEETQLDLGVYVETYPIEKHTRINFISKEKLVIIKDGSITEFYYVINYKKDIIDLTMIADPSLGGGMVNTFYFKIINTFKLEIGNLYPVPAVADAPMVIMTFEKENTPY